MSLSSSLRLVLASSPDGPIVAYDAVSGAALSRFSGSRSPRNGLALVGEASFAATHIFAATASGEIRLYNWWSPTASRLIPLPEPAAPLAASPGGSHLFAGGVSGSVHVVAVPEGALVRSVAAHGKAVSCFAISPDGSILFSGGEDGVVSAFQILLLADASTSSVPDTTPFRRFRAHDDSVTAVSCLGISDSTLISSSMDCTVKIWSLTQNTPLKTVSFPCPISGLAANPTSGEFFSAGSDGSIYLAGGDNEPAVWGRIHGGAVAAVAVAGEGRSLVSASEDGEVWIWDVESGKVRTILGVSGEIGNFSDMAVAGGIVNRRKWRGEEEEEGIGFSGGGALDVAAREVVEMERMVREAGKDKVGTINMLESAIDVYEKVLEMILEGAKNGCSTSRSSSNNNSAKDINGK